MRVNRLKTKALTEEAKIIIYDYIKNMDLKIDNKLPNEDILADIVGVSRITIRGALNELASEGVISRKQGKGTFVNVEALNIKVRFNPVLAFKDMIENSGYSPSVKLINISKTKASKEIASRLSINENDDVIVADKVYYADKKPCAYCVDYFDMKLIGDSPFEKEYLEYEDSIFEYIYSKTGKSVTWDRVEILVKTSNEDSNLKKIFELEDRDKGYLFLKGVNFDSDDQVLIYSEEYIDTDFIQFNLIRQRFINY